MKINNTTYNGYRFHIYGTVARNSASCDAIHFAAGRLHAYIGFRRAWFKIKKLSHIFIFKPFAYKTKNGMWGFGIRGGFAYELLVATWDGTNYRARVGPFETCFGNATYLNKFGFVDNDPND